MYHLLTIKNLCILLRVCMYFLSFSQKNPLFPYRHIIYRVFAIIDTLRIIQGIEI